MQIMTVSNEEFNAFIKNHPNGDMSELTYWGELKDINGWDWEKVAVGDGAKITGATLLLFKKIPHLSASFCYSPRGLVVDWDDEETVRMLTEEAVRIAKERKAIMVRIDPDVDEREEGIIEKISSYGFKHKGSELGLYTYTQPRFHMVTDLSGTMEEVKKSFSSRTRTDVNRSLDNGLIFEEGDRKDLAIFHEIMKETGARDDFSIRGISYFERMYDTFSPTNDLKVFLVRLMPSLAKASLERQLETREAEIERLEGRERDDKIENQLENTNRSAERLRSRIEDMEKLHETHPEGKILSGAIFTQCGQKAYYLYGASSNAYREYMPNYFMQYKMMEYAKSVGCTRYDFGGISGKEGMPDDEAPGLYEFKKRWGSIKRGRVGEFDYVLKPVLYRLMEWAIATRKKRHAAIA